MAKTDVAAERAGRLVAALKKQRDADEYPLTTRRLRELVEPQASDDELFKALTKTTEITVAAKKDLAAPLVLTEDIEDLTASDLLVEFALGKLASAEKPLHAIEKVVAKVDKSLQDAFSKSLEERASSGDLPEGIGKVDKDGKALLYLEKYPPPAPKKSPALILAEQLLAKLEASEGDDAVYELAAITPADTPAPMLSKALAEEAFTSKAIALPVSKTLTLVALVENKPDLLNSNKLLLALLESKTSAKKPFISPAELATALPESERKEFLEILADTTEDDLPKAILMGTDDTLALAKHVPAEQLLSEDILEDLADLKEKGDGYPASLLEVAKEIEPTTTQESLLKLVNDKWLKGKLVFAFAEDLSMVVLAGDETLLADHDALLEAATAKLSTAEQPLHPLAKVVALVEKAIRKPFEDALSKRIADKALPDSLTHHEVKGKPHLRLTRHELHKPPEEVLAHKLIAALEAAKAKNDYPLPLDRLLRVAEDAPEKVVKAALAQNQVKMVLAIPDLPGTLVALSGDQERLLNDPRLLVQAVECTRAGDNQAVPVADLGKKLARELQETFTAAIEKRVADGSLPEGIACLSIKKKPHVFLMADLHAKGEGSRKSAGGGNFAKLFEEAFERLDQEKGGPNEVSLVDLRQEVPVERDTFDKELQRLRKEGQYSLVGAEGRNGITAEEREAGIMEHGKLLLFVSRRED